MLVTLVVAIVLTGWFFGFETAASAEIQLHDQYFVLLPWHVAFILWVVLTFVTFFIKGVTNRFTDNGTIYVLLFCTSLMLVTVLLVAYTDYTIMVWTLQQMTVKPENVGDRVMILLSGYAVPCLGFLILGFFLVRRLLTGPKAP
jgi:hypothetical protein